jgi:hypothetical protein
MPPDMRPTIALAGEGIQGKRLSGGMNYLSIKIRQEDGFTRGYIEM